ncbi:hypothetical protein FPH17_02785 [Corynebacterium godavarianum]|uniref:Uncharacterized protein n=1 Tax=Corynebacterium godavarianum TaxID=2054421 RepID=A0ABY3E6E6_9CORY|nr:MULTISPECIES: hypothetical protein [Corynebacterium]MBL7285809.1 hypothetical protein [Corynebacterium godavarianum]PAT12124.1 hypothetical protein CKJ83_09255 [Corynebacterium hadale]TSJ75364.1 hypothetical protein FPH17_02785 [Corynebacterium godavarianum]
MRQTILAGTIAAALAVSTVQFSPLVPAAAAAEAGENGGDGASSSTRPKGNKPGDPAPGLKPLDYDEEKDPMHLDPDKNPVKKVSSSEMFLDWTKDMEEGDGKDVVQAWAKNSSVPDTASPWELAKQEVQGSSMMSSGFFTGDFAQSSAGSSRAASSVIPVMLGLLVIGQLVELVMRGIRMAQQ